MTDKSLSTSRQSVWRRWLCRIGVGLVCAGLFALGHWGSSWLIDVIGVDMSVHARHAMVLGVVLYGILMAIPFMPGIEVSLALFAAFGSEIAMVLYGVTVMALMASFLVGRMLPTSTLEALFGIFGLRKAQSYVHQLSTLKENERIAWLTEHAPKWTGSVLIKHRYLAIAIAFNMPGNALIGGGGGIALLAGMSRVFSVEGYLVVVLLATLPVPLGVLYFAS